MFYFINIFICNTVWKFLFSFFTKESEKKQDDIEMYLFTTVSFIPIYLPSSILKKKKKREIEKAVKSV